MLPWELSGTLSIGQSRSTALEQVRTEDRFLVDCGYDRFGSVVRGYAGVVGCRGYATQALHLLEERVWKEGLDEIRLYVFGHNTHAWALYQKMGYGPVSLTMAKAIGQPA